ncbi:hypothetical protein Tco_0004507 [Tanacetum coccineum]
MQKLKEHEQKLNALTQINHVEAIEDSVKANMPKSAKPSRKKRSHDDRDPLKNHDGEKKMKRRKGAGGSLSKKAPANTSTYERFEDAHEPKQEQEEVAQHNAFIGEHAHWFKKPYEKRAEELPEQSWFNELVNADKDPGEHEL